MLAGTEEAGQGSGPGSGRRRGVLAVTPPHPGPGPAKEARLCQDSCRIRFERQSPTESMVACFETCQAKQLAILHVIVNEALYTAL